MNRNRILVLLGGILLIVGAIMPWATVTSDFLGVSRSLTGIEGDGILTAGAGAILILISLLAKGRPGMVYSPIGIVLSLLSAGLLLVKFATISSTSINASVSMSIGAGLTCISPLGVLFGFLGSVMKQPAAAVAPFA